MLKNRFEVDNITWNDLSLEDIYSRLNSCTTSAGDDFLYNSLKRPYIESCDAFDKQQRLFKEAKGFTNNSQLKRALAITGKIKNYSFLDEIQKFSDTKEESNIKHYIIDALVILSFLLIFVFPGPGMVAFFIMIAYSVSAYFKTKNIIAGKLAVFNYIVRMIKAFSTKINIDAEKAPVLAEKINRLNQIALKYRSFTRGTFIISEGAKTNSNPISLVFDYTRMIFHIDIIKYNSMVSFLKDNIDEAKEFYDIIGEIDTAICINGIKDSDGLFIETTCDPEFVDSKAYLNASNIYHPLVEKSVKNSINTEKNVLITGCNASGKSTFLKIVAINAIFAQGLGICFADSYKAPFFKIYSSMALKDDINASESYFMSEIKSLKRIIDAEGTILCVIDEVLRGTNTVERIAASVEILKSLCRENTLCFVATHDIELTEILSNSYENYHFTEEILENDVKFSYEIQKGPANSRNAIRLLSVLGYDENIVKNASFRADEFLKNGAWSQ